WDAEGVVVRGGWCVVVGGAGAGCRTSRPGRSAQRRARRRVAADAQPARESIRQALLREAAQLKALADHLGLVAPAREILPRRLDRLAIAVGTELHGEASRRGQLGIAVAVGRATAVSA